LIALYIHYSHYIVTILTVYPLLSLYTHYSHCILTTLPVYSLLSLYTHYSHCILTTLTVYSLFSLYTHYSHCILTTLTVYSLLSLYIQGEDSEMAEHDDEKIEDPINDEVSKNSLAVPDIRNKARFWRRKQSCHM